MADQAKIPILLYHFPQVTGIDLTPEAVATLSDHPNIIGMKDSSGNLEGTKRFIAAVKPGFRCSQGPPQCWRVACGRMPGSDPRSSQRRPIRLHQYPRGSPHPRTRGRHGPAESYACAAKLCATGYGIPGLKYAMDLKVTMAVPRACP